MKNYCSFRVFLLTFFLTLYQVAIAQDYEQAVKNFYGDDYIALDYELLKTSVEKNGMQNLIPEYNELNKKIKGLLDQESQELSVIVDNYNEKYPEYGEDCQMVAKMNAKARELESRVLKLNRMVKLTETSYNLCVNNVNNYTGCQEEKNMNSKYVRLYNNAISEGNNLTRQGKIYDDRCRKYVEEANEAVVVANENEEGVILKYKNLIAPYETKYYKIQSQLESIMTAEAKKQAQDKRKLEEQKNVDDAKEYYSDVDLTEVEPIPFFMVEKKPVLLGCETSDDSIECFKDKFSAYLTNNFNHDMVNNLELSSGKKNCYIQTIIDKNGRFTNINVRGSHEALEKELLRIVNSAPQMIPGAQNGINVPVKYTHRFTIVVD